MVELTELEDATLIGQVAHGNEAAFSELYDRTSALVFGICRKVLRDHEQAREVTQEVFVELWRVAARFDQNKGSVRTWVATVAHRRAVDRVRSEQSRRNRELADANAPVIEFDEVSEAADRHFERSEVGEVLDTLSQAQREAVTLAYWSGHTYRDVARLLGIPEGTAKTRIRDALIVLREQMGAVQ